MNIDKENIEAKASAVKSPLGGDLEGLSSLPLGEVGGALRGQGEAAVPPPREGVRGRHFIATRNACKLCTPLGACLAYKGIKGCVPLIHGSQGCATYIRRYMISHFREPVDIASSNFDENATIFGGKANCHAAINNIITQYKPEVLALTTTCLSETIGDDVKQFMGQYIAETKLENLPVFVTASTPSYQGTHADGFHEAILSTVTAMATKTSNEQRINLFPGMFSPADLRYLKQVMKEFGSTYTLLPDYSETLDGSSWSEYKRIPDGGTTIEEIKSTANAQFSIEFGKIFNKGGVSKHKKSSARSQTAAGYLKEKFNVEYSSLPWPIGVEANDIFFKTLGSLCGKPIPEAYQNERGRLIDAYADGHKYVFGKKAIIYGEEDLVLALYRFLNEIGVDVIVVASGGKSGTLAAEIAEISKQPTLPLIRDNADFEELAEIARELKPDLLIGHSKGYYIARELDIPLVRVGFPIHDRLGGQRILHIGYEGTNNLFENIVNAMIEQNQNLSEVGYKYM
jgi:nitrogenase molybdenum-iron protein NifN